MSYQLIASFDKLMMNGLITVHHEREVRAVEGGDTILTRQLSLFYLTNELLG